MTAPQDEKCLDQVAYFMRRLYRQGLTTTSGGNISCRMANGSIAISTTKSDKAELRPDQVSVITLDGKNRTPELKPTIEAEMHLEIYRCRTDVKAIVHAHPVTASAFCASSVPIDTHLTAESYALLSDPVWVPYARMGSDALALLVASYLGTALCALMQNHGILTVGDTLLAAFDRLEVLETAARHTLIVRQLGTVCPLSVQQRDELDAFMGRSPDETSRA